MTHSTAFVLAIAFNCEVDAPLPTSAQSDVRRAASGTLVEGAETLGLDIRPASVVIRGISEAELANGRDVVALACKKVRKRDKRGLRLLIDCFPFVVLRVPEVHEYLDRMGEADAMRIAGLRKDQGPERWLALRFAYVRSLDAIRRARGVSIAKAASALSKVARPRQTARALRNMHSELRPFLRLRTEGHFVPAADLMPSDWTPKSQRPLDPESPTEGDRP